MLLGCVCVCVHVFFFVGLLEVEARSELEAIGLDLLARTIHLPFIWRCGDVSLAPPQVLDPAHSVRNGQNRMGKPSARPAG